MKREASLKRRTGLQSRTPLQPGKSLARRTGLRRTAFPRSPLPVKVPAVKAVRAQRRKAADDIPASVCDLVDARDSIDGVRMCVHCGSPRALHRHHRRFRSHPGPCKHCPCNVVSICAPCHHWAHVLDRRAAEAEGLILAGNTKRPRLHSVLRHGPEGSGARYWPTCDGRWTEDEPARAAA